MIFDSIVLINERIEMNIIRFKNSLLDRAWIKIKELWEILYTPIKRER
jgi:hypothetical protein